MPDETLPIVYTSKLGLNLVVLAVCVFVTVVGIIKITDDSFSYSMERYGPFEITPQTSGWLMVAIGAPLAFYALVMVTRRCPRLRLDETGLVLSRCFGNPVHIPWSRLADVVVRQMLVPGRGRVTRVDMLYARTDDGKQISLGNYGRPEDIADAIRRVAARMKGSAQPPHP